MSPAALRHLVGISLSLAAACRAPGRSHPSVDAGQPLAPAPAPASPPRPGLPWLKGQTHVHSNNSGDSNTPPEAVARWYAGRGYDFIVFTDHNRVTQPRATPGMMVFAGVELTWNASTCGPPDSPCNLHMNALFARPAQGDEGVSISPRDQQSRASIYEAELGVVQSLGAIAQLNHPNFHYGAGSSLLVQLARQGLRLVEFSNASLDVQNEGDATHPSTEVLWDQTLSAGVDLWNIASDDAHHYDDAPALAARSEEVFVGERGWVMVRAAMDGAAIREALMRGEFYATTGVILDDVLISNEKISLTSRQPGLRASLIADPGRVVATASGPRAELSFAAAPAGARWVRAVVEDGQGRKAWVQPLRLERGASGLAVRGPFAPVPAAPAPPLVVGPADASRDRARGASFTGKRR